MRRLRDLLAANNWKEADAETANVIFELAKKKDPYGRWYEDMDNVPCEDLLTINQLWVDYSNGLFGFSVQAEIYERIGVTREYKEETWQKFGDTIGWRVNNKWIAQHCTFDLTAPQGHLPVMGTWEKSSDDDPRDVWKGWSLGTRSWYSQVTEWHLENAEDSSHRSFSSFMSRLIYCNICGTAISDLKAHLVLTTKFRRNVLTGEMLARLREIVADLCQKSGCKVVEFNGEEDHIHLLFQYYPQMDLAKFINKLKSVTSQQIRSEFEAEVDRVYWKNVLWNESYFIASCGDVTLSNLRKYIEKQETAD